jgi:hypothetical protein
MKKKKNKIMEPNYICCEEYKNFCAETVRRYVILTKTELLKRLNQGSRFDYIFRASDSVPVNIQISLEEDNNDRTTI